MATITPMVMEEAKALEEVLAVTRRVMDKGVNDNQILAMPEKDRKEREEKVHHKDEPTVLRAE